jgi:plasmid stabilization system protein ParE
LSLPIRYSLRAKHELLDILDYIDQNFGRKKAKEIYQRLERAIDLISEVPEMFPESKKRKGLRRYVFSKQTSIYYRINSDSIEIVSLRPNRKDPKNF